MRAIQGNLVYAAIVGIFRKCTQTILIPKRQCPVFVKRRLCLLVAQDVGVTGVEDGHGGATEELTASGTKLNLHETTSKHLNPPKSVKTSSLGKPQNLVRVTTRDRRKCEACTGLI